MERPVIGITMGDPCGISPEIIVKALRKEEVYRWARPFVVGDAGVLNLAREYSGLEDVRIHPVNSPVEGDYRTGVVNVLDLANVNLDGLRLGEVQAGAGRASFEYVQRAIELAMAGEVDAVATTSVNKMALRAGGVPFIGHTEMFAKLTGTRDPLTMFETRGMRVFFYSRHISLREAPDSITEAGLVDFIARCTDALRRLGVTEGRMAVAALNPHCGDGGMFGSEEERIIRPAVDRAQALGYAVEGPIGADSVFHQALMGKYSAVLSLYHDQGHIATKTLDFERTIALTNNMPFLRTSVDHGTAFDIAGKGIASCVSMVEAIRLAAKYAPCFRGKEGRGK